YIEIIHRRKSVRSKKPVKHYSPDSSVSSIYYESDSIDDSDTNDNIKSNSIRQSKSQSFSLESITNEPLFNKKKVKPLLCPMCRSSLDFQCGFHDNCLYIVPSTNSNDS